tara:strand:- start:1618 stop:2652 length:1035 start_codon:yes stop_codon:yes gene_type:complete
MKENKIIIDLDNTITLDSKNLGYEEKLLNEEVREAISNAKRDHDIIIFTARNMLTLKGDLKKIKSITKPIAEEWLSQNNVYYDELIFGKPFCGKFGAYVDDKGVSIDEFVFKFNGPFRDKTIDIVIPFFNEEKNIINVYNDVKRLERIFKINSFIFVNNGSTDNSQLVFDDLENRDVKVKVLKIKKNIGYGYGIKLGLNQASSDYILINHSDSQFDTFSFFLTHINFLSKLQKADSIFSVRKNRPIKDYIITLFLRIILSLILLKRVNEFNGQPKLIKNKFSKKNIDSFPDDFSLDFALYKFLNPKYFLPVIQKVRLSGVSSWSGSFVKSFKILIMYIFEALKK